MIHAPAKNGIYIALLVGLLDQASKWWLVNSLMQPAHTVAVAPFLNLVLVRNKGITFGFLNTLDHRIGPYLLAGVALVILFFLGRWLWLTRSLPVALGLGAVMGGAFGNVCDRVRDGSVIDFLDFYYNNYHWYAFNIADAGIVAGVTLLLLDSLVRAR
jgi:signal peptidase II